MEAGKRNPWLTHVKKTLKAHKGKSFKAVLKMAKATYKKKGGADEMPEEVPVDAMAGGSHPLSPAAVGGRRRRSRKGGRKTRKTRKGGMHGY